MTAIFLHTYDPQPILAKVGAFSIHWYGLLLAVAAAVGYLIFRRLGRGYGLNGTDLELLFFWTVIAGLVGARLYHVSNEWGAYASNPVDIVKIWNGGLAIHGAIIAGLLVLILFARRKNLSFWLLGDIAAPAFALGQAIGRWGNYFNQELFGRPTSLPWGIPIQPLNRPPQFIENAYFHPAFLYEFLGSLLVFTLLMILHRKRLKALPPEPGRTTAGAGAIMLTYFILESIVRTATEFLRIDRVPIVFGVRLPLLVSLALVLATCVTWMMLMKKPRRT